MRRASHQYVRRLECRLETFLLQVLDMLLDRGLNLVLVVIDRISAGGPPAESDLVYVHDDEASAVPREALGERERLLRSARAVSRPDDHLEHSYFPSFRLLAR